MKHELKRERAGKAEMGSITPTCSCGWRGRTEYAYNDYCHTNVKEQEGDHIRNAHRGELETANATLEQQGDTCPTCGSECNERDELTKAEREIERLRAEVEVLRADAERWEHVRSIACFTEDRDMGPGGWWTVAVHVKRRPAANTIDAAIDAAMAQGDKA